MTREILIANGGMFLSDEVFETLIEDYGWSVFDRYKYDHTEDNIGELIRNSDARIMDCTDGYVFMERGEMKLRTDEELIEVVKDIGLEEAYDGRTGEVKIVEVPEDIEIEIHERYPMNEVVVEKHRTWS